MSERLNLKQRVDLTSAVLAQFRAKPFSWNGRANCVHLARAQLAAMGHAPPPVPHFTTQRGALMQLRKRGVNSLAELIDRFSPRIPPASAWVGDLVLVPGDSRWDALAVHAGGGVIFGWQDGRMGPVQISGSEAITAWRLGETGN